MARFHGEVGYGESVEDPPGSGKWVKQITEREYYGDITRKARGLTEADKVNDDIFAENSISVLADEHAFLNFSNIVYVRWEGTLWTVTSVEVRAPRLILSIGRVYNGPTP